MVSQQRHSNLLELDGCNCCRSAAPRGQLPCHDVIARAPPKKNLVLTNAPIQNFKKTLNTQPLSGARKGAEKASCETVVQKGAFGESIFFSPPSRFALKSSEKPRI